MLPSSTRSQEHDFWLRNLDERAVARLRSPRAGGNIPRRPLDPRARPRLHERYAGPAAVGHAAAEPRCGGRTEHRRIHHRLPRQPARLGGPDRVAGPKTPRRAPHQVPLGAQRRPRRHQRLGHAAGGDDARREVRRRLRHVVRQGAGRGPLRRCLQARQCGGHQPARRRAGAGRRRPRRQEFDAAAPVGPRLQGPPRSSSTRSGSPSRCRPTSRCPPAG